MIRPETKRSGGMNVGGMGNRKAWGHGVHSERGLGRETLRVRDISRERELRLPGLKVGLEN